MKKKKNILDVLTDIQKQKAIVSASQLELQVKIKQVCQPTIKVLAK